MRLTESMEDYLETIYRLTKKQGYVRAVDICEVLQVQASSVTRMIQKLDESGFLHYVKYRNIALTPKGEKYGKFLVWRDSTLKKFLYLLDARVGIDEQVEGIEHYITPKTIGLIRNLLQFFAARPDAIDQLHALFSKTSYPDAEHLPDLRAWEFRHSMDDL